MKVRVVIPTGDIAEWSDVAFVSAQGVEGSIGILPRRRDFVSPLVPGILTVRLDSESAYVAVDGGLLLKRGRSVTVATSQAVRGDGLKELSRMVSEEFEVLDEKEKRARSALVDLEMRMARRFLEQERRWRG